MNFELTPKFILAGRAVFTIFNDKDNWYTYKVTKKDSCYFVSLLSGPKEYVYLGMLPSKNGQPVSGLKLTKASKMRDDSTPVKVFRWALNLIWAKKPFPEGYGARSEGKCGRCGRSLTAEPGVNPEGERYGFGPVCWDKIQNG
jgi:hypothetical protein